MWNSLGELNFEQTFKVLSTTGAIGTFIWTVYWTVHTWRDKSRKELEAATLNSEHANLTRRIEATKPFLDRQLELYTAATHFAATLATSEDPGEIQDATRHFLQLYSGELALVENRDVATAMDNFFRALPTPEDRMKPAIDYEERHRARQEKEALRQLSLNLATACRESLALSWGVKAWSNSDDADTSITTARSISLVTGSDATTKLEPRIDAQR